MLKRIACEDRESWLIARGRQGIGGSEAAAAVGLSPWMTPLELWRLKTGQTKAKDLSGNAAVEKGNQWEPILRDLFAATHPEYQVEYHQYDILYQDERPWLFATLDGELLKEDGRKGVLEIKTATPNGKTGWGKWSNGSMPENYYVQCCHELLASGFDFVRLFACLFSMDGSYTIKEYEVERCDAQDDIDWLLEQETRFWNRNVLGGMIPATPLVL